MILHRIDLNDKFYKTNAFGPHNLIIWNYPKARYAPFKNRKEMTFRQYSLLEVSPFVAKYFVK